MRCDDGDDVDGRRKKKVKGEGEKRQIKKICVLHHGAIEFLVAF